MKNKKKKIGLFFGAGAEMAYGLPSGGRFALDIFRMDNTKDKKEFKEMLSKVKASSAYAAKWLPYDYKAKAISSFGKSQYEQLIISTLEHKRTQILDFLNNFDTHAEEIKKYFSKQDIDIDTCFNELNNELVGNTLYSGEIQMNEVLGEVDLFKQKYFSALLKVLVSCKTIQEDWFVEFKNIIRSFIELLIGSVGEEFLHKINDAIFKSKPDDIDIFDDFCGYFSFDYKRISGLDYILQKNTKKIDSGLNSNEAILEFARLLLEQIFIVSLDYQSLIDSHYHYLFTPNKDWAKFCKISIFLMTVRRYIEQNLEEHQDKISNAVEGYYHDVKNLKNDIHEFIIGTSNYNMFIKEIIGTDVAFLNGSTNDFYDPYANKILTKDEADNSERICVPLLFTQSGIKPLTTICMSRRYVNLFDKFSECDEVGVVGFGFNSDDSHINGIFRELLDQNKKITVFDKDKNICFDERLRSTNTSSISLKEININTRKVTSEDKLWIDTLINKES